LNIANLSLCSFSSHFWTADRPSACWLTTEKEGEFHVDLYTLPDALIKMLWDFTQEKGVV